MSYVRYDSSSQGHDRIDRATERAGHVAVGGHSPDSEQNQKNNDNNFDFRHD